MLLKIHRVRIRFLKSHTGDFEGESGVRKKGWGLGDDDRSCHTFS